MSKRYFRSIGTESVLSSFFFFCFKFPKHPISKSFLIFAKDNTSNSRENSFLLKNQFSTEILIFLTPLNVSIRFFEISNFFNIIESIRSNGCNSNNFGIVSTILKWPNNFHKNRFSTRSKRIKNHFQISEEPQFLRSRRLGEIEILIIPIIFKHSNNSEIFDETNEESFPYIQSSPIQTSSSSRTV